MFFPNNRSCEVINWPDFQFKTLKLSETEGYQWDQYWRAVILWCGPSLDHPGRRVADGRILFLSDLLQQAIDFPHPRRGWGIFFPISMISYDFYVLQVKSANLYNLSPTLISAGVGKKKENLYRVSTCPKRIDETSWLKWCSDHVWFGNVARPKQCHLGRENASPALSWQVPAPSLAKWERMQKWKKTHMQTSNKFE